MSNPLVEILERYTNTQAGESPFATLIKGVTILRSDDEDHASHIIFKPALCVVVQGAKWTTFGNKRFDYRAGQALVVSVELPGFSRIVKASPTEPYLAVVIEFDPVVMRDVMERLETPPRLVAGVGRGVFVSNLQGPLADCVLRMVKLLDTPEGIPILAPLIVREMSYWLLTGPHGGEVANFVLAKNHLQGVIKAIHALRNRYSETLSIDELSAMAGMSPSAFHRQFKALTSMSPLQYQKQLRLLEARHLMLGGAANAETAAFQVGYESPSQFNREYTRMFGAPPRRDVIALRSPAA